MSPDRRGPYDAVVIGGSAGALEALETLLAALPSDLMLAVVVVLHQHRFGGEHLPRVLGAFSRLPVRAVVDKGSIEHGNVYVCPANYQTLIERSHTFALSIDEPVQFARPSIDVLFESASYVYGPALVGVVLSGGGADGSRGAVSIESRGGVVLCQDPSTAVEASMPRSAGSRCLAPRFASPLDLGRALSEARP
jgi:two-component system chemotaxis response regulator CheB